MSEESKRPEETPETQGGEPAETEPKAEAPKPAPKAPEAPKPAAEGTNALLQALHADPASTLYVGDSNVDVETAHNANLPCCGAVWGFRTREELNAAGAEYLAENSDELYDVIMK